MDPLMSQGLTDLLMQLQKGMSLQVLGAATACVVALIAAGRYIRNSSGAAAAKRKREKRQEKRRQSLEKMRAWVQGKHVNTSICRLPFRDLRDRLQNGQLMPSEVLLAFQAQALVAHERVNCVTEFIESAQRQAEALDKVPPSERGPLHGIPVSLKESICVKGSDTTIGLACYVDVLYSEDAALIQLLVKQGAVPFVRTNLSQAMISVHCHNPIFGETLNPIQTNRTCGGSSGGEGALIGSGASVLGFGSDAGGSNRVPAHFCGLVGMKLTSGRQTEAGTHPFGMGIKTLPIVYSPICRDVETVVTYLRSTLVPYMYHLDPLLPCMPWREELYSSSEPLTIGFYTYDGGLEPIPAVTRAVRLAKERLETLGHKVVEFQPPDMPAIVARLSLTVVLGDRSKTIGEMIMHDEITSDLRKYSLLPKIPYSVRKLLSKMLPVHPVEKMILAAKIPENIYEWWKINYHREVYTRNFFRLWKAKGLDGMICPAYPHTAWPVGQEDHCTVGVTNTSLYNIVDCPCGVVPATTVQKGDLDAMDNYPKGNLAEKYVHKISEGSLGLPVGVQCVSLPYQEEVLLRLMSDLETALRSHSEKS